MEKLHAAKPTGQVGRGLMVAHHHVKRHVQAHSFAPSADAGVTKYAIMQLPINLLSLRLSRVMLGGHPLARSFPKPR